LGLDRTNWSDVIARLPETVAVASVDVRGHGLSTNGTSPLTLETAAADIAHVIREAGWQSAIVVGCSMGGCIAQAVAAYHREIVEGLVLIDTTAWYGPDAPATWAGRAVKAESEGFAALLPFQRERWFSPAFLEERPDVLQHCVDVFLKNDIVTYKAACAMLGQADLRAHLPKIGVPTAVVVGEEDYATPPAMAEATGS
jgi:3-oxoadipate enol-lactonase